MVIDQLDIHFVKYLFSCFACFPWVTWSVPYGFVGEAVFQSNLILHFFPLKE